MYVLMLYILKPWDDNDLIMCVKNAIDVYEAGAKIKRLLDTCSRTKMKSSLMRTGAWRAKPKR
jgi:hypothetical protein